MRNLHDIEFHEFVSYTQPPSVKIKGDQSTEWNVFLPAAASSVQSVQDDSKLNNNKMQKRLLPQPQ